MYPVGSIKQHPATLAVAVRTVHPEDSPWAWSLAEADRTGRFASWEAVKPWPDLLMGVTAFPGDGDYAI